MKIEELREAERKAFERMRRLAPKSWEVRSCLADSDAHYHATMEWQNANYKLRLAEKAENAGS